ncbi:carboxypeptidase-like regulatory domain-containing protein [Dyella subtropica]|uniref:carboxypeptidase-like regulatory domain-containing protein n=1 Tax=Dyella subtropica TaxID=2992127 RepID=UPI002251BFCB|nr:carboxypeptidase-like regulatory domain-containing protein [Dyella subtropica]
MKSIEHFETLSHPRRVGFSVRAVAVAVAMGLCSTAAVTTAHAQETTASIFGQAPAGATITVHSTTGVRRHATANAKGHYTVKPLPLSIYTVTLEKDGKIVDTRANIPLKVSGGAEVDFACPNDQCAAPEGG